ncbi:MAG: hypothetical protein RBQ97_07805 [Acholeplasma sp.]|nr:hypothetical protein [Acholeplasma sp.]
MQIELNNSTPQFNLSRKDLYIIEHTKDSLTLSDKGQEKKLHCFVIDFAFEPYHDMWLYEGDVIYFDSSYDINNLKDGDRVLVINKKSGNVFARKVVSKNGKLYFGFNREYDYISDSLIPINTRKYELLGEFFAQNIENRTKL